MKNIKNETKAVILKNNQIICFLKTNLKNGSEVEYSYDICEENIDADREYNLVNSKSGKISRAKKYLDDREEEFSGDFCEELSEKEFFVQEQKEDFHDNF